MEPQALIASEGTNTPPRPRHLPFGNLPSQWLQQGSWKPPLASAPEPTLGVMEGRWSEWSQHSQYREVQEHCPGAVSFINTLKLLKCSVHRARGSRETLATKMGLRLESLQSQTTRPMPAAGQLPVLQPVQSFGKGLLPRGQVSPAMMSLLNPTPCSRE